VAEEAQGQAQEQPALIPQEMDQFEAVDHIAGLLEKDAEPVARDETTGQFRSKQSKQETKEEEPKEEVKAEETEEAVEEEAPPPPRKLKLKYKGEDIEKDEPEVIALAQQGFDYTQKSQALSKERDEMQSKYKTERETASKQYEAQLEVHKKALSSIAGVKTMAEIEALSRTDPVGAQQEFLRAVAVNQAISAIDGEQVKIREERQTEMKAAMRKQAEEAVERLESKIPGWNNDLYGKVLKGAMKEYEFRQQEVNAITDSRAIEVLHDALKWREFQTAKPKTTEKKVAAVVPKVIKPGTAEKSDPKVSRIQERKARLDKSGSRDDAVSYFEELLEQKKV